MTNDITMTVFDVVRKFVTSEQYLVLPKKQIADNLPDEIGQKETEYALNVLELNGLISVSFTDAELYCISLTAKGIREGELRDEAKEELEKIEELEQEKAEKRGEETPPALPQAEGERIERVITQEIDYKKLTRICAISSFLGALLAGLITMIVVLVKVA